MAQKTVKSNSDIAKQIKNQRIQLKLTIEEAASKAGVGTKTWSRYEAGESIREDKCKGVCRALNWRFFPNNQDEVESEKIEDYEKHEAWSTFIAEGFGYMAAVSFAVGSDLLLDEINMDLDELSERPRYTHIGQLTYSHTKDSLPPQFLTRYDYEFLYQLRCSLLDLRERTKHKCTMYAHTVLEEILYYMCVEEATVYVELMNMEVDEKDEGWEDWIFDLFDDADVEMFLYSGEYYVTKDCIYHFDYWGEQQFYMDI